jgi:hypothetical protein
MVTMLVGWREQDWSQLQDVVAIEEPGVRATLETCGLLKFFECPLIRAQKYLLQFLIQMWSLELHCFLVRGEQIPFTVMEDVYFLTGLPFWGTPLPVELVLPRGMLLATIGRRYCSGQKFMSRIVVSISSIDSSAHRCIAAMIVRVYRSLVTQRISGGQLLVLERVLADERFAWGLTLHARMVAQLDHWRSTNTREFAFGSILVGWLLERVSMLHPRILLGAPGAREPRLRQWSTVLLHHDGGEGGHFFSTEAAQVWQQMPQVILRYPYARVDFQNDPDVVLPPREVFDHRGMFDVYVYIFTVLFLRSQSICI